MSLDPQPEFEIIYHRAVAKQLKKAAKGGQTTLYDDFDESIEELKQNPFARPGSSLVRHIKGVRFRVIVGSHYRLAYDVTDHEVDLVKFGSRENFYDDIT
ncbi:MAG: type II toxin-antitoxin system mRNA interferase toxin, RelE/StbE family [Chloroflexi bacterium]|nr:type II toxin-antitoxin system mRNA interferase toxin, RelE/StbE family [Chloroflexota bacterium]